MARATWHDEVIAESDDIVIVESNRYFPVESVKQGVLQPSDTHTTCPWKGVASYYDVVVGGETNHDAAWYYPDPKEAANDIRGRIAFWRGVKVEDSGPSESGSTGGGL